MTPAPPPDRGRTRLIYGWAADRYLRALPPEHFMETTGQAKQRTITLESFAVVREARPDVQCFNERLVLYPPPPGEDQDRPRGVVPDNFVVAYPTPVEATTSFNTPLEPAGPFLVLEYVSKNSKRKDYDDNYKKYEQDLKVPYYLLFYPDNDELTLFRMAGGGYTTVLPNDAGRLAIPELELEAALLDGWVRFWFRGELVPLPGDLLRGWNAERVARQTAERRADHAEAELAQLREELARLKGQSP